MRRMKIYALAVIFTFFFIAIPAAAAPVAYLSLVDSPSGIDDTFEIDVWADGDNLDLDLVSFGFDVSFENGGIFEYIGYQIGTGFDDDSFGSGNVAGSAFPGIEDNDVLLATLSFQTLAVGTDTLNVIGLYDGEFSGIYYELDDVSLTGYDIDTSLAISSVPIPGTIFLMFSIMIGFSGMFRRSKK